MSSNLPPGCSGDYRFDDAVPQNCANGHTWTAPMYFELGGWFYSDENAGPVCPVCGQDAYE